MKSLHIPVLVAFSATVAFAQYNVQPPRLALQGEVSLVSGGSSVKLEPERLAMKARANLFTTQQMWRLLFARKIPTTTSVDLRITSALKPTDMPGGAFWVVRLDDEDDGKYFNTDSENASTPIKKYTVLKPKEFADAVKGADGLCTWTVPQPLKPGFYALYIADNQYGWAFQILK